MAILYAASTNPSDLSGPLTDFGSTTGLLGFIVYGTVMLTTPDGEPVDPNGEIDWVGAYLGVGALILSNSVW